MRHVAYAVQWFGLALALAVIYVVTNLRRDPARERRVSAASHAHERRQRRILIAVALLFFAPLGLAFYLYYGHVGWRPGRPREPRRVDRAAAPAACAGAARGVERQPARAARP